MPQETPAITTKNLEIAYGDMVIQRDLNFTVDRGEIFVLMGGSGCGKTTVMRCLTGLKAPAKGQVFLDGVSLWEAGAGGQRSNGSQYRHRLPERGTLEFHDTG